MLTAAVTGANRGIGLELCRLLCSRGYRVLALCRHPTTALDTLGVQVESGIDVTSESDLRRLAEERLQKLKIDLLINNAGILSIESFRALDFDSIRRQFEVNSLGPLRVTTTLLPYLTQNAKVAIVTSRMGSLSDNRSGGYYGYRMSMAALNMAGLCLASDLKPLGIALALLHPGYVRTDMTSQQGNVDAKDAACSLLARIDELTLETSGSFWHADGGRLRW
ncbi:MAG: SDR family oxidoreductase [Myxococcota bacterium]